MPYIVQRTDASKERGSLKIDQSSVYPVLSQPRRTKHQKGTGTWNTLTGSAMGPKTGNTIGRTSGGSTKLGAGAGSPSSGARSRFVVGARHGNLLQARRSQRQQTRRQWQPAARGTFFIPGSLTRAAFRDH